MLTPTQIEQFHRDGFVPIPQAFEPEDARAMQARIWEQIETDHGIRQDDRATWTHAYHHVGGLNRLGKDPVFRPIASLRLCGAIDALLGAGNWAVPDSWGGFLVTFPQGEPGRWDVTARDWHWDGDPSDDLSAIGSLFIFTLMSEIKPGGGGTLIVSGSPRLIDRFFETLPPDMNRSRQKPLKAAFLRSHPYFADLAGDAPQTEGRIARFMEHEEDVDGVGCRVVEVCGEPGDAFVCHPSILHAASPNHAHVPRFMRVKALMKQKGAL